MHRLWNWGATTVLCAIICLFGAPRDRVVAAEPDDRTADLVSALEDVGMGLSMLLESPTNRDLVIARLVGVPEMDAVPLRDVLWGLPPGSPVIYGLMAAVDRAEVVMAHLGYEPPRVDVFMHVGPMPAASTREQSEGVTAIDVAVAPLTETNDSQKLRMFHAGEGMMQPAATAPDASAIVVSAAESTTLDPGYPPIAVDASTEQENAPVSAGGYVGIPYLMVSDDHEPWWRGRPEIYVVMQRFVLGGLPKDTRVDFTGVNDAGQWYFLHDPNETYVYVDQHYLPSVHIQVWEDDGSLDPPDYLGFFEARWEQLPTEEYAAVESFFGSDASMFVDRD